MDVGTTVAHSPHRTRHGRVKIHKLYADEEARPILKPVPASARDGQPAPDDRNEQPGPEGEAVIVEVEGAFL